MTVEMKEFLRNSISETEDYQLVKKDSDKLLAYLNQAEVLHNINEVNVPGASSHVVQAVLLTQATKLGFRSEKTKLFNGYQTNRLRPDYYKPINGTGILFEVERGKTIDNNMDLLDLWKCHICKQADYLFLLVPKALRQNENGSHSNTYQKVCNRLQSFFEEDNYVNVKGLFVFGY